MVQSLDGPVAHVPQILQLCPSAVDALSNGLVILGFIGFVAMLIVTICLLGRLGDWLIGTAPCKWIMNQSDITLQEKLRESQARVFWLEERVLDLHREAGTTQNNNP